jgi:hypothetical protein
MDSAGLLRKLAAEQRREERAAVREFVDAAVSADEERFYNAMIAIDEGMPSKMYAVGGASLMLRRISWRLSSNLSGTR